MSAGAHAMKESIPGVVDQERNNMILVRFLVAVIACIAAESSMGQDVPPYPTKAVRLVVPAVSGGPVDAVARILADALRASWHETIIVENKPGAGNSTGAIFVAKAPPDGHTLLVISDSITINPNFYPYLSKDPLQQFEPIAVLVTAPQLLVARKELSGADLREFIALGTAGKEPLTIGSAGAGTISHLTQVLLEQRTGLRATHVHFRGAAQAVVAVLGGHVDATWIMPAPALPHIAAGKMKALAVTSRERDPRLPTVPTAEESGLAGFVVMNSQGLFAPAKTPKAVVDQIARTVYEALQRDEVRDRMARTGFTAKGDGPQTAAAQVRANVAVWAEVLRKAGIRSLED
jgi:tripartite-type tricarboxylate transporter receptor subunit TctC